MKTHVATKWILGTLVLLVALGAQAQIHVDEARIGCLDIQKSGNLTGMVGNACDNKSYCSFKAPTPDEYKRAGVQAQTRAMCSNAMEITYHCRSTQISVTVDGDAWAHHSAELTCESLQPLPTPQAPGARLRGWVDLHTHPLSNLGFGGKLIYGGPDVGAWLPADPDCHHNVRAGSVNQALGHDASTHGGNDYHLSSTLFSQCTDDVRKLVIHAVQGDFTGDIGEVMKGHAFTMSEDAHGAPEFTDWPLWNDVTHQKMWVDWIRRAYNAGLRVMVALAVNNKTLADAVSGKGDGPRDDKASTDLQIREIKEFAGRHPDFMEIALTSADLERIVRANKLAIVLGVEVDNIGNLTYLSTKEAVVAEIDHLFAEGVRYVFPIHLLDNPFGGTAAYIDLFNFSTYREEGHYWDLGCAPSPTPGNQFSEVVNYRFASANKMLPPLLDVAALKLHMTWALLPGYPNCPQTNNKGLSAQGVFAIKWMMHRGMLIDVDHMSDNSRNQTIELALSVARGAAIGYPLNSGHSGLRGFFPASDGLSSDPKGGDINERSTSYAQYQAIARLHGMVGIGSASLNAFQWVNMYRHVLAAMGSDGSSNGPIGSFGTDLNGLEKGSPPNTEQDVGAPNPQYTACIEAFHCRDASGGDTVRRPGGTSGTGASTAAACIARAQASCEKQYRPQVSRCVSNCGHPPVQYSNAFPMSTLGSRSWDYNVYGVAHYGMLADFLQDARNAPAPPNVKYVPALGGRPNTGANLIDQNLMCGADYFLQTWKKAESLSNRVFNVTSTPNSVQPGVLTTVVVQVTDPVTRQPVPGAVVHVVGGGAVPAGQRFQYKFTCTVPRRTPRTTGNTVNTVTEPPDFPNPGFSVTAPGYIDGGVEFTVSGIQSGSELCR